MISDSKLDNLNKLYQDLKVYNHGDRIPNWASYKFHSVVFYVSKYKNIITDMQVMTTGTSHLLFNDNGSFSGSFGINIYPDGLIECSQHNELKNSFVSNIIMWN